MIKQSLSTQLTQSPPLPLLATCSSFTFFWIIATNNHLFLKSTIFSHGVQPIRPFLPSSVDRFLTSPWIWFVTWKCHRRQIWMNDINSDDSSSLSDLTHHELISVATSQLEMSELSQPPPSEPDPWLSGSKAPGRNSTSAKTRFEWACKGSSYLKQIKRKHIRLKHKQ